MKSHTKIQKIEQSEKRLEQLLFEQRKQKTVNGKNCYNEFIDYERKKLQKLRSGI